MNTFKRKALFTAVVAGLGTVGTAEAVYLSPNNMGQVLVYPYYTTQAIGGAAFNTFISVVNTTSRAKAVKVRILEGKTSAEVLDFNLFLSPNDVWVAAIVPIDAASAAAGARLLVPADERSCTNPAIPAGGVDFRQFQYALGDNSLPGTGLDRTREGYIEILEMGPLSGTWATAVTHNSAGVPNNCGVVQVTTAPPSIGAPQGGLTGTGTLINVNSGLDAGYKADALDAWANASRFSPPDSITPNLASAFPASSMVLSTGQLVGAPPNISSSVVTIYRTDFGLGALSGVVAGARAVASVYMHSAVINEYILDTNTLSNTDWVITQPLKNLFVTSTSAATPYSNVLTASGACELVGFTFFNRDERGASASGTDFSPIPPGAAANTLCWESNVLSIRNPGAAHTTSPTTQSLVLGSFNVTNVNVTSGFQNGWATLSFVGGGASSSGMAGALGTSDRAIVDSTVATIVVVPDIPVTFFGLPVTGFMVRTFRNNTPLPCAAGSTATCANAYASLFNHSYRTTILP